MKTKKQKKEIEQDEEDNSPQIPSANQLIVADITLTSKQATIPKLKAVAISLLKNKTIKNYLLRYSKMKSLGYIG